MPTDMRTEMGGGANAALVSYLRGNQGHWKAVTYRKSVSRLGGHRQFRTDLCRGAW